MAQKSVYVAYFLWLIGGALALHLLYLRRDKQAFVYWCTFAGYFGLGALRDLYRIPTYVKDVNNDPLYLHELAKSVAKHKKPPFSILRFSMQVLVGNSWCYLMASAFPEEEEDYGQYFAPLRYCSPLASALGVWMIGNIGRQVGSFKWSLLGAFSLFPLAYYYPELNFYSSLVAAIMFEWKAKQWRRTPYQRRSICRRMTTLSLGWFLFCALWVSLIYFNGELTYKDGETVKIKDMISNFVNSPMYSEFKKNTRQLYNDVFEVGWSQAWRNLMELLDPFGEYHALKVLDLQRGATQEEITSRYKQLTKEWHPDRHKDAEKKKEAHEKFIEIASAYENLSTLKRRRNRKNTRSSTEETQPL